MNMFSRKRKFKELYDNEEVASNDTTLKKRHKLNNYSSFNKPTVKKTFARNRRNKTRMKHLNKSIPQQISDSDDSDFDPNRNNSKKSSCSNRRRKKLKKVQSTLDLAIIKPLSNINKSKYNKCVASKCSDCGMLYYIGGEEDDSLHSKFHKKYMDKFEHGYKPLLLSKYIVWNYEQIAKNVPYFIKQTATNNTNVSKKYKQMTLVSNGKVEMDKYDKNRKDLILCIKYDAYIELKSKNADILSSVDMMDRELGYFTTKQAKNNGYENKCKDIIYSLDDNQSLYCFVEKTGHKIVGCIICEPREYAYKIKIKMDDSDGNIDNVERSNVKQKCYVGIVKIWVHNKYRRQSIASLLMDCMRKHFIYGTQIHKKYIAFCQPTRMGQKFAHKYCQTKHLLVY